MIYATFFKGDIAMRPFLKQLCAGAAAALLAGGGLAFAETIVFKSGKVIEAPLLSCNKEQIKIEYQNRELFYDLVFVKSIEGMSPEAYFLEKAGGEKKEGYSCRRHIDYGLDIRTDMIVFALSRELSFCMKLPRMKSVEEVTNEFFNGGFHSEYMLCTVWEESPALDWDYENVIEEFREVVTIDPYASVFYYDVPDKIILRQRLFEEAAFLEKTSVGNRPDAEVDRLLKLGMANFMCARPDQAIAYFEKAIEKNSGLAEAHGFLGIVYCSEGEFEKGRQQLHAAYLLSCQQGHWDSGEDIKFVLSRIP